VDDEPDPIEPAQIVVTNTREIARRVGRSFWWVGAAVIIVVVAVVLANAINDRSERDSLRRQQVQARTREREERAAAQPIKGDTYELTSAYCNYNEDSATYTARLTNTSDQTGSYTMTVKVLDQDGTRIGGGGDSVSELPAGASANLGTSVGLTRFVDGPPAATCAVAVERTDFAISSG
jgi:hypothetical protein